MENRAYYKLIENIKKRMKKRHMTQKELAIRCGLSEPAISQYMNYARKPTLDHLFWISVALGCNIKELLDGIETEDIV